jgi:hypothetical protein
LEDKRRDSETTKTNDKGVTQPQSRNRNWYGEVSPMTPEDWDKFFEFIRCQRVRQPTFARP